MPLMQGERGRQAWKSLRPERVGVHAVRARVAAAEPDGGRCRGGSAAGEGQKSMVGVARGGGFHRWGSSSGRSARRESSMRLSTSAR